MTHLAIAIMGHPSRQAGIKRLQEQLRGEGVEPHVELDVDGEGPWPVARRCWGKLADMGSHALIIQDDAVLCMDFYAGASRAIRHRPSHPIAFYANCKTVDQAREAGRSWARVPSPWGVAQSMPSVWIPTFTAWADKLGPHDPKWVDNIDFKGMPGDDWFIGEFFRRCKIKTWATVPSLVEHGSPKDSLMGHRQITPNQRVARWFIGEDKSALSVDWRKK